MPTVYSGMKLKSVANSSVVAGFLIKRLNVNLFLNFTKPVTLFTLSHPRGIMAAGCQVHTGTRRTCFFKGSLSRIIIIFFLLLSFCVFEIAFEGYETL